MGYLFLAISLFTGVTKGFCGKKTSGFANGFRDAVLVNIIRMLLCVAIGFVFVLFGGGVITLIPNTSMMCLSLLAGVATAVFAVTWLLSVRVGAYMLVDIALMCSVFVPVIGSLIFLNEGITWQDIVGMVLLVASVVLMCLYNNKTKTKLTILAALVLLTCGVASGFSDFSQKLYVANGGNAVAAFSFYTYVFAGVTLLLIYICTARRGQKRAEPLQLTRVIVYIVVMALCMFAASFFQTLAASKLSAATLYPLARGCALILSAVMSRIFFGEKFTVGSLSGMGLAIAALIIINL